MLPVERKFAGRRNQWVGTVTHPARLSYVASEPRPLGLRLRLLVLIDVVQIGRVFEDDLPFYILGHPGKVTLDHLARFRPRGVGVGEIRCPHIVGWTEQLVG